MIDTIILRLKRYLRAEPEKVSTIIALSYLMISWQACDLYIPLDLFVSCLRRTNSPNGPSLEAEGYVHA